MAASDLRREYEVIVERAWRYFRSDVLSMLKNNLPTSSGTIGNYGQFSGQGSLAGKNLYATGNLRDSYGERFVARTGSPGALKITSLETDVDYAVYYANGRANSSTYHGFDFIDQTKRDVENKFDFNIRFV